MVVLDSVYNFTPGLDLKDRDVGALFARLKSEICDSTGCTVVVVDHMPWANEHNRKRLLSYGDVFKRAAARAGIYIDAEGEKLWVEARGNYIRGFKRTPAYWDADALELRLVDVAQVEAEALDEAVLKYVTEHPGEPTVRVEDGVEGGRESVRKSLERLASHKLLATGPGRQPRGKYWYPAGHAALHSPGELLASLGDISLGLSQGHVSPESPRPYKGGETSGDTLDGG